MFIKTIRFINYEEDMTEIKYSNIDVFVDSEDGYTYIVILATPKNLEYRIDENKMNYFGPNLPYIFVKELTKEIIEETVKAYAKDNDGYLLKSCHFAGKINKTVFNQLQAKYYAEEAQQRAEAEAAGETEYLRLLDKVAKDKEESDDLYVRIKVKHTKELKELDED